jgi:hypothetical protein
MEKYGAGSIVVSDYDPNWPILFEQESTRIKKAVGSFALAIEHMGSTAVPGLPPANIPSSRRPLPRRVLGARMQDGQRWRLIRKRRNFCIWLFALFRYLQQPRRFRSKADVTEIYEYAP